MSTNLEAIIEHAYALGHVVYKEDGEIKVASMTGLPVEASGDLAEISAHLDDLEGSRIGFENLQTVYAPISSASYEIIRKMAALLPQTHALDHSVVMQMALDALVSKLVATPRPAASGGG